MIQAVIYDLDDTLYDFYSISPIALEALSYEAQRRFGIEAAEFARVFNESFDGVLENMPQDLLALRETDEVGIAAMHSRTLRLNYTLERLHLPVLPHVVELYDVYWETILDHMQVEPHLIETLEGLKKRGIRIGIGTNMTARMQYRKAMRLGLAPYIDFMMTSDESIFDKPDSRFFTRTVEKAGCRPEECLFVGDNYLYDVLGARSAGLQALWYARLAKPWNHSYGPKEEETIRDHREILAWLERTM